MVKCICIYGRKHYKSKFEIAKFLWVWISGYVPRALFLCFVGFGNRGETKSWREVRNENVERSLKRARTHKLYQCREKERTIVKITLSKSFLKWYSVDIFNFAPLQWLVVPSDGQTMRSALLYARYFQMSVKKCIHNSWIVFRHLHVLLPVCVCAREMCKISKRDMIFIWRVSISLVFG